MIINGTELFMIRGDSESLTIITTDNLGLFKPLEVGDTAYLTVKKSLKAQEATLQYAITEFTDGKAVINILPSDTKQLKCGVYIYDVQITKANGTVKTIILPSRFEIGGEVTNE